MDICDMRRTRTDIFVVSYAHDLRWLEYCVKSIRKFATGFGGLNVLVPTNERALFEPLQNKYRFMLMDYQTPADKVKHHIAHQLQKLNADRWCPDCDYVMHIDSDCCFLEPVTPEDYFSGDKPVMFIEEFSRLKDNPWQKPTEETLKRPVSHETMRRHPQVNPRGVYGDLRAHIEEVQGMPFDDFVLSRKPTYPWGLSEHCLIGAFAMNSDKWASAYAWVDLGHQKAPKNKLIQFWSWSPPEVEQDLPSGGRAVPIKVIEEALAT
jgi:hypothetical protein